MHVLVLRRDEILLATDAAVQGTGNIEAAVADTLYLGNFAEHGANLSLGFIREMGIAHLIKVLGNLNLHIV